MGPEKGQGSALRQWRGPGSPNGSLLLAYCGNRRSVRPLFLFSLYFYQTLSLRMAAMTWEGMFGGHKRPLFHPKRKPFLEKAVQTNVDSPGMFQRPPPIQGAGLG